MHDNKTYQNKLSLGLRDYPDTEQDFYIDTNLINYYDSILDLPKIVKIIQEKIG